MKRFYLFLVTLLYGCLLIAQNPTNQVDENGKKHGLWKGVFAESQRVRYEGTFDHGKETGTFTFYHDVKDKKIAATRKFDPVTNESYTTYFNIDGSKVCEGKEKNRLQEGEWKYYHENSKTIMTLEVYKDGKLEGPRKVFYKNEALAEEVNYKNNLKEGIYKKYTEKGGLLEESNYTNGEYQGLCLYYDPEGNVVAKGNYKKGKKTGIWQFFIDGKLDSEENMSLYKKPRKKNAEKRKSKRLQDTTAIKK